MMRGICPELRELVVAASQALARLDAERLEELALSCQSLNRDLARFELPDRAEWVRQANDARGQMAVFGRVLDATRANLAVTNRARERRSEQLEYGGFGRPWALEEKRDGND